MYVLAAPELKQVLRSTMSHLNMSMPVAIVICSTSQVLRS